MPGLTIEEKQFREEHQVLIQKEDARYQSQHKTWEEKYVALVEYQKQHGDCNVPQRYKIDLGLGAWVGKQRKDKDKLSADQRSRLDQLNFDWETRQERNTRVWNEKFERLKVYRRHFGNCRVPQSSTDGDMVPWVDELGTWVRTQRSLRKTGKLTDEQTARLDSIDFEWVLVNLTRRDSSNEDRKWFEQYQKLKEFHKEHGHCIVPCFHKDKKLGRWVGRQRQKHANKSLPKERQELLDQLNFVWKVDKGDADASLNQRQWDESYQYLVQFKEENGHVDVPRSFSKGRLGSWLCTQRADARKGLLDPRRAELLMAIGVGWGKNFDQRWEERFLKVKAYRATHGHCCVTSTESVELRHWIKNQRDFEERGTLLPERKARLNAIGFTWKHGKMSRRVAPAAAAAAASASAFVESDDEATETDSPSSEETSCGEQVQTGKPLAIRRKKKRMRDDDALAKESEKSPVAKKRIA